MLPSKLPLVNRDIGAALLRKAQQVFPLKLGCSCQTLLTTIGMQRRRSNLSAATDCQAASIAFWFPRRGQDSAWRRHRAANVSWVIDSAQDSALLSRPLCLCSCACDCAWSWSWSWSCAWGVCKSKLSSILVPHDEATKLARQLGKHFLAGSMKQLDSGSWQRLCFSRPHRPVRLPVPLMSLEFMIGGGLESGSLIIIIILCARVGSCVQLLHVSCLAKKC